MGGEDAVLVSAVGLIAESCDARDRRRGAVLPPDILAEWSGVLDSAMEASEAVELAKRHVAEMFEAEPIKEVGLEEVELQGDSWLVTIGFTREWPTSSGVLRSLGGSGRTYKIVRISDKTGSVQSLRHRDVTGAGLSGV